MARQLVSYNNSQAVEITPKQCEFAHAVARGRSQADAYRTAFNVKSGTKPETIHSEASRLMRNPKVAARIEMYRALAAQRTAVTIETITDELNEAIDGCRRVQDWRGLADAAMKKAKLHGLIIEKRESTSVNRAITELTDYELLRIIAAER